MKCPKCQYVSHDYLDTCRKCGVDLVAYKQQMGLLVLQPGELDLGLVFAGNVHEDLFGSLTESGLMPSEDETDFDISLEDAIGRPGMQWPYAQPQRAGAAEGGGLDHLTLELDAAGLPPELLASAARELASSSAPPSQSSARPSERARGLSSPSEHLTLEMEAPRGDLRQPSREGPGSPPPAVRPAASTQELPESRPPSTPLTLSSQGIEFGRQAPNVSQHAPQTPPPPSQSGLGVTAAALGAAALGAAAAGALSSGAPPAAGPVPPASGSRNDDLSIPMIELIEPEASSEPSPASPAGSVDMDLDSFALSADHHPFADVSHLADREPPSMDFLQSIETSGAEASEPLVDVPLGDDTLELSYSEEEMAASFRKDASSASSGRTTDVVFTPSDMRVLESMVDDGERAPSHLTVELDISNMDLGTPFSLAEPPLMGQTGVVPEGSAGAALTPSDMRALGGEGKGDDDIPPGHLTLELDAEEFETSLDAHRRQESQPHSTLAREQPPAEPPGEDDEILLDLDDIALEGDEQP